MPSIEVF